MGNVIKDILLHISIAILSIYNESIKEGHHAHIDNILIFRYFNKSVICVIKNHYSFFHTFLRPTLNS